MSANPNTLDYDAIKTRQRDTWASGDYAVIGTTLQIVGETLCEAVDVSPGERVLDVAAGNGNAALAAARRGADVIASDYVGRLLERTRVRAAAEGLALEVREADAETLPFPDATFDAVLSTFGVMFTPQQALVASELVRVLRPGGRIGLANWTPQSFVGQMFQVVGRYAPPPAGIRSPLEWGTAARLEELFGTGTHLVVQEREYVFRYRTAQDWLQAFRDYYGPVHRAFAALGANDQAALQRDLLALASANNTSPAGALRISSAYLEAVATKHPSR